ncbi:hypothetical protein [Nocardia heshunensis]
MDSDLLSLALTQRSSIARTQEGVGCSRFRAIWLRFDPNAAERAANVAEIGKACGLQSFGLISHRRHRLESFEDLGTLGICEVAGLEEELVPWVAEVIPQIRALRDGIERQVDNKGGEQVVS